jgi:1-acyl-sn-glycerol-3-phosphate acyltransferase
MRHPRITWFLSAVLTWVLVDLRVRGRDNLPAPEDGPVVVACRHLSWIDPLLIIATLGPRRPVVFLAAREHVERRVLLDRVLTWLGAVIKVERGAQHQRDVLRAAGAALELGVSLALFPEGKINKLHETGVALLPLEPGAVVIARRAGVPVVPFSLAGSAELHVRRRVLLVIGAPLPPGRSRPDDAHSTTDLTTALLALSPATPPLARFRPGRWLARLA